MFDPFILRALPVIYKQVYTAVFFLSQVKVIPIFDRNSIIQPYRGFYGHGFHP